jgi:hypothetical protein
MACVVQLLPCNLASVHGNLRRMQRSSPCGRFARRCRAVRPIPCRAGVQDPCDLAAPPTYRCSFEVRAARAKRTRAIPSPDSARQPCGVLRSAVVGGRNPQRRRHVEHGPRVWFEVTDLLRSPLPWFNGSQRMCSAGIWIPLVVCQCVAGITKSLPQGISFGE